MGRLVTGKTVGCSVDTGGAHRVAGTADLVGSISEAPWVA